VKERIEFDDAVAGRVTPVASLVKSSFDMVFAP